MTDVPTPQPFAYLGTPNVQLYAAILGVFALALLSDLVAG